MDTERDLLFGVVAFQSGAVDADYLAATCASWVAQPTLPLADLLVDRGRMTDEQRTEVERAVARELATHGGDPRATLAATIDGRTLEVIGDAAAAEAPSSSRSSRRRRRDRKSARSKSWACCRLASTRAAIATP